MFKVNNKDNKIRPRRRFCVFIFNFEEISSIAIVSIADFEQANTLGMC